MTSPASSTQMEHIHFYQRSVVCRDIPDPADMDFNTCYACVMGTTKHVGTSWVRAGATARPRSRCCI